MKKKLIFLLSLVFYGLIFYFTYRRTQTSEKENDATKTPESTTSEIQLNISSIESKEKLIDTIKNKIRENNSDKDIDVYQKIQDNKITRFKLIYSTSKQNFTNMMWDDILDDQEKNQFYFGNIINKNLINDIFFSIPSTHTYVLQDYFWKENDILYVKTARGEKWKFQEEEGVVLQTVKKDRGKKKKIIYADYISFATYILYFLISILISYLILQRNALLAYLFLAISCLTITIYMLREEYISTWTKENARLEHINNSILSLSFLIGVNMYILSYLQKEKKDFQSSFFEQSIIFSISIILLLKSLLNTSSPNSIKEEMIQRISRELLFTLAILVNATIIFSYFIILLKVKKL